LVEKRKKPTVGLRDSLGNSISTSFETVDSEGLHINSLGVKKVKKGDLLGFKKNRKKEKLRKEKQK
jgi:hypothetical protein